MPEFHPIADLFPLMQGDEYETLKADIAANGLRERIWLHPDGRILDGRNRYRACEELGTTWDSRTWDGEGSLVSFVVSLNLHRRHLSESQRAMVAAKIANMPQGARTDIASIDAMSQPEAAKALNVSRPSVQRAKRVIDRGTPALQEAVEQDRIAVSAAAKAATSLPSKEQDVFVDLVTSGMSSVQARRELRDRNRQPPPPLPPSKFSVIYADPPWQYDFSVDSKDAIEVHYPTMPIEKICNLPVSKIAHKDCVLFLWATSPKLREALRVVDAWGFAYKTCMVWDKDWIGPGYYARQRHELLLIATMGRPGVPLPANRPPSVYTERRTRHSKKPDEFYEIIERMYPDHPRVELFSRQKRTGWAAWGDEV